MTLQQALDQVPHLTDDQCIFARRHPETKRWTMDSEAEIGILDQDSRVPQSVKSRGLDYFLEITVINEILEILDPNTATPEQRRALILFYAEYDAFPDWIYETKNPQLD